MNVGPRILALSAALALAGVSVSGQSVTLTDTLGHQITGTIPTSSGGSIGAQFPMICQ